MPIAKEGIREIVLATVVLGGCALGLGWLYPPLAAPFDRGLVLAPLTVTLPAFLQ